MSVADLVTLILALSPIAVTTLYQIGASQRNNKICETDLAIARELAGRTTTAAIALSRSSCRDFSEKLSGGQLPSVSSGERPRSGDQEVPLPAQSS